LSIIVKSSAILCLQIFLQVPEANFMTKFIRILAKSLMSNFLSGTKASIDNLCVEFFFLPETKAKFMTRSRMGVAKILPE